MKTCRNPVNKEDTLSIRKQCEILSVNRSSLYYAPVGESEENPEIMRKIDEHYLDHSTEGVLRVRDFLFALGFVVNHKRVRRLLRLMGLMAIYPKRNPSKLGLSKYIRPYLLKGLKIERPNQVWAIDITYIPMKKGFLYLTAIIDLYSRYIVGWGISNTLEAEASPAVMKQAVKDYGKPGIINSDQGSRFTCEEWISYLESEKIKIGMDGKGRAIDNAFIERFWRSLKYDYVYLHPAGDGLELYKGLKEYMHYYNYELHHQGIDRKTPAELYRPAA